MQSEAGGLPGRPQTAAEPRGIPPPFVVGPFGLSQQMEGPGHRGGASACGRGLLGGVEEYCPYEDWSLQMPLRCLPKQPPHADSLPVSC